MGLKGIGRSRGESVNGFNDRFMTNGDLLMHIPKRSSRVSH